MKRARSNSDVGTRIPKSVKGSAGFDVDLSGEIWWVTSIPSSFKFDWAVLTHCDTFAVQALRLHIARLIASSSGNHSYNVYRAVARYLLWAATSNVSPLALLSLRTYLQRLRRANVGYVFHLIRRWYQASCDRSLDEFDDDIAFALYDMRIEGNVKGDAVMSNDPREGPLTAFEEEALRSALLRDDGPIEERTALWLALAFGCNASNIALLQEEDLITHSFEGTLPPEYSLRIPRIKKRHVQRKDFKERYVAPQLAATIKTLIASNEGKTGAIRPLFFRQSPKATHRIGHVEPYASHPSPSMITELIARAVTRLGVISHRTQEPLHVTTRRLRYTFAMKMVRQGATAIELAELLDHTDAQNVTVYYKADSRFTERLDETIARHIGPQVQAFMGQIVPRSRRPVDLIPYRDLPALGQCGASFLCGLSAPKNCYTCAKFIAFQDGAHQAALTDLVQERDSLIDQHRERVAEQLNRVIFAVGEVVAQTGSS